MHEMRGCNEKEELAQSKAEAEAIEHADTLTRLDDELAE